MAESPNAANEDGSLVNRVREFRLGRNWSQDELAVRAGLSRPGVSAIEVGRVVPATTAALALARAFDCRVEDLFLVSAGRESAPHWAWPPRRETCRYWNAVVGDRLLSYPVEPLLASMPSHDGVWQGGAAHDAHSAPTATLVLATCDPAVNLLADELARMHSVRVLAFPRSSREAMRLLADGVVHAAGVHFGEQLSRDRNCEVARETLGDEALLVHVARWSEGIAHRPDTKLRSFRDAFSSRVRWIGRQEGSAARDLQDELLGERKPPRRSTRNHRSLAEAIRDGWADAGICVKLTSEEAGIDFLSVRDEPYDLCVRRASLETPRVRQLLDALRSPRLRAAISDLPGYSADGIGETRS